MRTFEITVSGTVVAMTEEEAIAIVQPLIPNALGSRAVSLTQAEIGEQVCAECWCYVDSDSRLCEGCGADNSAAIDTEAV